MKKRRADPHVRDFILSRGISDGKATTPGQLAMASETASTGQAWRWRNSELCALRAANLLSFQQQDIFSISFDGARYRKPAKELLVGVVSAPVVNRHSVLPPHDLGVDRMTQGALRKVGGG